MNLLNELKQQLNIMKSLNENKGSKLEYFKKELLKILDKQEKEEFEEICKAIRDRQHLIPKQIQSRNAKTGKIFTTTVYVNPNKQYGLKKYKEQDSHGAKIAIGKLKKAIENCKTEEELYKLVLRNKDRFSDENGKPLEIVQELKKDVDVRKKALNGEDESSKDVFKEKSRELLQSIGNRYSKERATPDNSNIAQNDKVVKQKINPESFPERFRENPDMSKVINFIEKGSNNENLNFLFNNLNSILGNMYCFTTPKRAMFSWKNQTVEINKIGSDKDINDIETAIHEVAHALDFYCGEKRVIGMYKDQVQATQKDTGLRTTIQNSYLKKMPENTLKMFSKYENIVDGKCEVARKSDKLLEQGNKIRDDYMAGKIDRQTATKEINEINKQIRTLDQEYAKKINDSGIGHLEDIYDALSGGKFRDQGLLSQGHGKSVYNKVDERTSEIFANYIALSFTQPELIENYLRKDTPELCSKLDDLIKKMADKQKEKLGIKKSITLEDLKRLFA